MSVMLNDVTPRVWQCLKGVSAQAKCLKSVCGCLHGGAWSQCLIMTLNLLHTRTKIAR